jgi:predicted PurR-regulated permease PerM
MPSANQSRVVSVSTGTILKTIAILVAVGVLWLIRDILLYVFTAMLIAGVVYPFAHWAEAKRIPKGIAVLFFYIVIFGVMALAFALLIPAILREVGQLLDAFGKNGTQFRDILSAVKQFAEQYGLQTNLQSNVANLQESLQGAASGLFNTLTSIFGGIAGFFIVLVLSFYMIAEEQAARNLFKNLIPTEYQEFAARLVQQMIEKLGSWLRGQLVLGLIIGTLYFIGFTIIGVPYALLLALLGGLLEFVPYLGPLIAAIPAVFLAATDSPLRAVATLVLIVIIQQLENNVIVPKVMQRAVGLNPIVSIIAFMIGAKLFGVVGAIFAIPVATAASVAIFEIVRFRRG